MKGLSVLLLAALLVTALSPIVALTFPLDQQGAPVLGTLDVCHQANPAVSPAGLMPFINECPCSQVPSPVITYAERSTPLFLQFLLSSQHDRPPQA